MKDFKPTVVFDFDGVIHSYTTSWIDAITISDEPVNGIKNTLRDVFMAGYEIVIVSSRCSSDEGRSAIWLWLEKYELARYVYRVCKEKPPALVYIDDRAICFDGHPETLLEKIQNFKPWNK